MSSSSLSFNLTRVKFTISLYILQGLKINVFSLEITSLFPTIITYIIKTYISVFCLFFNQEVLYYTKIFYLELEKMSSIYFYKRSNLLLNIKQKSNSNSLSYL